MSIIILLAAQALGPEITTFHPLPPKEQQEKELRKVQGLPVPDPKPVAAEAQKATEPEAPKPAPDPEAEQIKVTSVRVVAPTANVIWVPPPPEEPK